MAIMEDVTFYAKAFISLLVLINPLEGIPIYLSGTEQATPEMRLAIAKRSALAVTIILLAALFLGKGLLALFSISTGAFQIGGGLILFLIAVNMVLGAGGAPMKSADGKVTLQFAIVPLAIPIMAGPGAINGAVLYGTQAPLWPGTIILAGVTILVGLATYGSLRAAVPLVKYLKTTGIDIASRIMGLIIAAIAIEMVAHGIGSIFGLKVS
ncbi:MAG: MarC family protein [Victivallaceae bacterium]|nr:MarC family protein [Victivallaceae bacterium]